MSEYILITSLCEQSDDSIESIYEAVQSCDCSVVETKSQSRFGGQSHMLYVSGNWNALAKLENQLTRIQSDNNKMHWCRTDAEEKSSIPYIIEGIGLNQIEVLIQLHIFLRMRNIHIVSFNWTTRNAIGSHETLVHINSLVHVPLDLRLSLLREEFLDFIDQFNLDAILEPVKITN